MTSYLFDSFALLKLFQKEAGHAKVATLLEDMIQKRQRPLMHIINLAEILYLTKKRFGEVERRRALGAVYDLDFEILSATDEIVYQAAELKGIYPISFGDCFALAGAINYRATIVTGDPDFKKVQHLVEIEWV